MGKGVPRVFFYPSPPLWAPVPRIRSAPNSSHVLKKGYRGQVLGFTDGSEGCSAELGSFRDTLPACAGNVTCKCIPLTALETYAGISSEGVDAVLSFAPGDLKDYTLHLPPGYYGPR